MSKFVSIAIDGPAGAGKSTMARACAKALGYLYVDTGAIYRTVGYYMRLMGIGPKDQDGIRRLIDEVNIDIRYADGVQHMILNGEDVTSELRTPEMSMYASGVSAQPCVRAFLLDMQRQLARTHNVIMDGRDIGTVVLPHADVKIFLTADAEVRAKRRYDELQQKGDKTPYAQILAEIGAGGNTEKATRLKLSAKAYTHTAEYDAMIATYMRAQAGLNEKLFLEFDLVQSLRYGENPHQSARFYREGKKVPYSLAFARQLNGKELSYNNIQDANAALCIVREFDKPFCVGLKHMNPCGAAVGKDVVEAWTKAYEADKVSIFGGIVATNRTVTKEAAELMKPIFLEIIMAPKFDEGALEVLCTKKNLRLLEVDMEQGAVGQKQYVSVNGGLLVQDLDVETKSVTADMCVTAAKPAAEQMDDMNFGWHIVKHVKSNAIVVVKDGRTLGVGAGQMNRIGSAEIALKQAHAAGVTEGLVLASDGFFPFDDCVTLAAEYGVTAIVQPGGSVRDEDSVKKADEKGIAMVFTGERHFKH